MAGYSGYSVSASDASPRKRISANFPPASDASPPMRTPSIFPPASDAFFPPDAYPPASDAYPPMRIPTIFTPAAAASSDSLDGGGGGEGRSSNNSNDLWLVDSTDSISWMLPGSDSEPMDMSQLLSESSRLPGVADKDFVGKHANQISSSESDGEETMSSGSSGFETNSGSIVSINEGNREFKSHVPEIGMSFSCEQEAYKFYQKYAIEMGFKVRKGKVQRLSNGSLRKRYFYCSEEGFRSKKAPTKKTTYTRKETRTGCNAKIQITFENERCLISEFISDHNHDLQGSTQRHYIDPNSKTSEVDSLIQPIHEIGITKETEAGFCDMNYSKHLRDKQMNSLQPEDAQGKMTFCAGIHSIQGSEKFSNANVFQNRKSEAMTLPEYVQKYEKAAEQQRREELHEDFCCNASEPMLILGSPMEKQAANIYTRPMFEIFRNELIRTEKCRKIAERHLESALKEVEDVLKEGTECLDTKAPEIYVHKKSGVAGPIKETNHDQEETSKRRMECECQIQKKHKHN
ncbi:protein FAR1-RELATED SEQUENCE 9-like [Fagus crenata]